MNRVVVLTCVMAVIAVISGMPAYSSSLSSQDSFGLAQLSGDAGEETVRSIEIQGNQRIEDTTILSYLSLQVGEPFSADAMDRSIKELYGTGLFADVKLIRDGSKVIVRVVENPVINNIAFEGNEKIEDEKLESEIQLRERSVFTRTAVQKDVQRLLDIYRRSGRFSVSIDPKVIQLDQNRVDLVFEISEGEITSVKKISFIGNEIYDDEKLRDVIRTRESRWYRFFTSDDTYDPDRMKFDQELLRRFYVSHGYADFQVKSAIAELTKERDGFYITFTVEEGERYKFGDIKIISKLPDLGAEELRQHLLTEEGETFNAELVEESIDELVKVLGDLGYAFVRIDPQMDRDEVNRVIDLTYVVEQGPRVYVERIEIQGNVRTQDEVIRREFRLSEGDPYNATKMQRSEQRIRNLGFFEKVKITNVPGSAPDRTVIQVEVTEQSTGELSFGAGFSTVDGALADIGIQENNLLGRGQKLRLNTTIAAERQEIDLSFTEPYFLDRDVAAGFDVFSIKQDLRSESSYDRELKGFKLRGDYAVTEHLRHSVFYSLREDRIADVQPFASRFIRDQEGQTVTSSIGHAITYDWRDNRFDPTDGHYVRFSQDLAGFGGDVEYLRNELRGGYFYSVYPQWVLKLLAKGGYIFALDDEVRINDRFFLGSRDMRGFDNAGIGPRDTTTEDALGGNIYYATTAEMGFPLGLPEELGFRGAVFVDAGSLWDTEAVGPEVVDNNSIRVSAGVGVSWASPFGPIRIDLSQPVVKESEDITETFRFSFGTRF